jgi:hypothetical protein
MPDPTAHADDMKSPVEYVPPTVRDNETLPPLWWFNPWNTVLGLLHKVDHLKATSRGEQAARIEAAGLANLHKTERYDFLRNVEVTLEAVLSPDGYNDTIDLVVLAADEIKALRASLSVITEDRDAYIEKLQAERDVYCDTVHKLEKAEARVKQLTVFCENAGAERDYEKKRVEEITLLVNERDRWIDTRDKEIIRLTNLTRNLKRKLSKAEKAKPLLWEDKTKTLTHGAGFTFGNHEDRPIRAALGSIRDLKSFVHGIQPKAKKPKKKGGAK